MGDIVKGVLGGGWSLVVGWILPTAVNLAFVWFAVRGGWGSPDAGLLVAAAVLGLLLASVQTPIYRVLEGYTGWSRGSRSPYSRLLEASQRRQLMRKQVLRGRLDLAELGPLEQQGRLRSELGPRLAAARADARVTRYADADARRGAAELALLRERLRRYPVDDAQVIPTRLGNAIRRLEEYGYDRYRLDSQTLWYELTAVAGEQARTDVERARTTVDFLVCLLTGHLLAAVALAATGRWQLIAAAVGLVGLSAAWYWVAVLATDDWAAATRSLVNLGRAALAAELALKLPPTLAEERTMWATVARLSARPYDERSAEQDPFRDANPGRRLPGEPA